jgi:phosphoglycolate phosphatase
VGNADILRGVRQLTRSRPPRFIVFDLDGTLIDSRRDLAAAANAVLAQYGAPRLGEDAIGRMVGEGAATLVARAFAASGARQPADALDRFLQIYETQLLVHTRPYPRVPDMLGEIGSRLPMAVLTNKPIRATRAILQGLELAHYFKDDAVVGGDGPLPRKPDPAGLHQLCARVAVAARDTLLVGDSIIDLRTARAAGASICLVRYGFGFESVPVGEIGEDDWVIDTPDALIAVSETATLQ